MYQSPWNLTTLASKLIPKCMLCWCRCLTTSFCMWEFCIRGLQPKQDTVAHNGNKTWSANLTKYMHKHLNMISSIPLLGFIVFAYDLHIKCWLSSELYLWYCKFIFHHKLIHLLSRFLNSLFRMTEFEHKSMIMGGGEYVWSTSYACMKVE
jgi:hypothetical protein